MESFVRLDVVVSVAAIFAGVVSSVAVAQTQLPAAQQMPAKPAPAVVQPAAMSEAERDAYIAKAWSENRVFGADNGAFFRP
jgi:hypothetical protein